MDVFQICLKTSALKVLLFLFSHIFLQQEVQDKNVHRSQGHNYKAEVNNQCGGGSVCRINEGIIIIWIIFCFAANSALQSHQPQATAHHFSWKCSECHVCVSSGAEASFLEEMLWDQRYNTLKHVAAAPHGSRAPRGLWVTQLSLRQGGSFQGNLSYPFPKTLCLQRPSLSFFRALLCWGSCPVHLTRTSECLHCRNHITKARCEFYAPFQQG